MNIPATVNVPTPAGATGPDGTAGAPPAVAAAAGTLPAAATTAVPASEAATAGAPARPAPGADAAMQPASPTNAFKALLASLGLPAADAASGDTAGMADETAADEPAAPVAGAADMPAPLLQPQATAPVPSAELTPAWRSDAAMLMASLPQPPAAALPVVAEAAVLPAAAAPAMAAVQAALPTGAAHTRMQQAARAQPQASALPTAMPVTASATPQAATALPSLAAVLPREAAPVQPADAAAQPAARHDDTATVFSVPPVDGAPRAVDAGTAVNAAAKPVPAHGQALLEALGERVQVQIAQRSEHAVIRLDPQAMGSVEIVLRHEAGALQVHLSASHPDVQRQLHSISDALRQDLSQRQYTDVSVNVAAQQQGDADGRRRQGGQQPAPEQRPGQALAEAERGGTAGAFSLASSLE